MLESVAFPAQGSSSFRELIYGIDHLFESEKSAEGILNGTASILTPFGKDDLCAYLSWIAERDVILEQLAKRAYLHGNGFYKIPLYEGAHYTIRLHIWPTGCNSQENLHSHSWPFVSRILSGEVYSEIWTDCIDSHSTIYDEYHYQGKHDELRYVGRARVRLKQVTKLREGTTYVMYEDTLHRIIKEGGGESSTLIIRANNTRSWARNIVVNDCMPVVRPEYMDVSALRELFRRYVVNSGCVESA